MPTIKEKLKILKEKISESAKRVGRNPNDIKIIAVSKKQPMTSIQEAYRAGLTHFGENYVQEFLQKHEMLQDTVQPVWHFIGHLQSNKVKDLVGKCEFIHSVDSLKLAKLIDKQAASINIKQKILLQINLAGESQKSGFNKQTLAFAQAELAALRHIIVVGFMLIPPLENEAEKNRPYFKELKKLLDHANASGHYQNPLTELSMGMTQDYEIAIEEGATMVRIGTFLFGARL